MSFKTPSIIHKWKARHAERGGRLQSFDGSAPLKLDTVSRHTSPAPEPVPEQDKERRRTFAGLSSWFPIHEGTEKHGDRRRSEAKIERVRENGKGETGGVRRIRLREMELKEVVEEAMSNIFLAGEVERRVQEVMRSCMAGMMGEMEKMKEGVNSIRSGTLNLEGTVGRGFENLESRYVWLEKEMRNMKREVIDLDLKAAIRLGELSNESREGEKLVLDRLWGVESELGMKVEGVGRRVVGVVGVGDELGRGVREMARSRTCEEEKEEEVARRRAEERHEVMMCEVVKMHQKMEDLASKATTLEKNHTIARTQNQGAMRDVQAIRKTVEALDLSPLALQAKQLQGVERQMNELKREVDIQGTLASLDSKLLSAFGTKLEKSMNRNTGEWAEVKTMLNAQNEEIEQMKQHDERNMEGISGSLDEMATKVEALPDITMVERMLAPLQVEVPTLRDKLTKCHEPVLAHIDILNEDLCRNNDQARRRLDEHPSELQGIREIALESQGKSCVVEQQIQGVRSTIPELEMVRDAQDQIDLKLDAQGNALTERNQRLEMLYSDLRSGIDKSTRNISNMLETILTAQVSQNQVIEEQHNEKHGQLLAAFSNATADLKNAIGDSHAGVEAGIISISSQLEGLSQFHSTCASALAHTLSSLHNTLKERHDTLESSLSSLSTQLGNVLEYQDQHEQSFASIENSIDTQGTKILELHESMSQALGHQNSQLERLSERMNE